MCAGAKTVIDDTLGRSVPCKACGGTGKVKCPVCDGEGKIVH
jgi:DnaJ-class molecular chaperone